MKIWEKGDFSSEDDVKSASVKDVLFCVFINILGLLFMIAGVVLFMGAAVGLIVPFDIAYLIIGLWFVLVSCYLFRLPAATMLDVNERGGNDEKV